MKDCKASFARIRPSAIRVFGEDGILIPGSEIFTGTQEPEKTLGKVTDIFIHTLTGEVYKKTTSEGWIVIGILPVGGDVVRLTESYLAVQNIAAGQVVYIDQAGFARLADCRNVNSSETIVGISSNSALAEEAVLVIKNGYIEHEGYSFNTNKKLYVGYEGALVEKVPADAKYQAGIGFSVSMQKVSINVDSTVIYTN